MYRKNTELLTNFINMSTRSKLNTNTPIEENTGFGANAIDYGGRLVNKDGSPNIHKTGIPFFEKFSWFHSMLTFSKSEFFLIVLCFYLSINMLFTLIYYMIGTEHLAGLNAQSGVERFSEAFFFSTQTFTTVGYGRISPVGFVTSAIAAFEALIGLMSFAVITGLLYGRFSRPVAYLKYADNALISPYKEITGLMIRLAPFKNTTLTEAVARLTMVIANEENGKLSNKFYNLDMEMQTINSLTLSWTLVHPITAESPLYNFSKDDFANIKGEILVFIKAFDDLFSNTVISRTSYTFNEVVYGGKFTPMFHRNGERNTTVLELEKLNVFTPIDFNQMELLTQKKPMT